jgi:hypothetical protein
MFSELLLDGYFMFSTTAMLLSWIFRFTPLHSTAAEDAVSNTALPVQGINRKPHRADSLLGSCKALRSRSASGLFRSTATQPSNVNLFTIAELTTLPQRDASIDFGISTVLYEREGYINGWGSAELLAGPQGGSYSMELASVMNDSPSLFAV